MTQSVQGTGHGACNKYTTRELSVLANAPTILVAGRIELTEDMLVNPPAPTAYITLPQPLPGSHVNYVVLLTGLNSTTVYVADMNNNSDGDFSDFQVIGSDEGTCMYAVMKLGYKPEIPS